MADTARISLLDAADVDGTTSNLLHALLQERGNVPKAFRLASHTALARRLGATEPQPEDRFRGAHDRLEPASGSTPTP